MAPSVATGGQPQKSSFSAILYDLQVCISEPGRILHGCARDILRRLLFGRATARSGTGKGTGGETVSDAVKLAGAAAEKETIIAANVDEESLIRQLEIDGFYYDEDLDCYGPADNFHDLDDDIDRTCPPPSFRVPCYDEDGDNTRMASCNSRRLVELLAVRPHFPFLGTFVAFNDFSEYSCSSQTGQTCRNLDSQGNLILHSEGAAIADHFSIRIHIPKNDNRKDDDIGCFSYIMDPYTCGRDETHIISTGRGRRIEVTFLPMHTAVQAHVYVTLDLISSGSIYHVYGEIAACHQLYGRESVVLFSCGKEDKAEVIDGKLPLSREWAVVPIYLKPLLTIKLNLLCVPTNQDHDDHGRTVSFQGDIAFYRDDYEKIICTQDHDKVKVRICYR
ncbi:hypothetical protein ACQ4PT_013802 [Festuca glaucescens]